MKLAIGRFPRCDRPVLVVGSLIACLTCTVMLGCDGQDPGSESRSAETSSAAATRTRDASPPAPVERPNIVLFIVDTLRADALGPYRDDSKQTPGIAKFARDAIVFENAFAQSSWTRASVASILTSHYPTAHGAEDRGDRLAESATLLSETFSRAGYHTGLITTNPNVGSFFGFDQGFAELVEMFDARKDDVVKPKELTATADDVAARVNAWLDGAREPFLLVVLSIDPHSPYTPPREFLDPTQRYEGPVDGTGPWINRSDLSPEDKDHIRALYQGEVNYADHGFARVLEHLRARGLDDRTITVLTSDHGEEFWEHGRRGHGRGLYRETLQVPLLVRVPWRGDAGRREDRIVESIDIFPTLLALASVAGPRDLSGKSLLDDSSPSSSDGSTFASLRLGEHHLASLRTDGWQLIWDLNSGEKHLFDIPADREVLEGAETRIADMSRTLASHLAEGERQRQQVQGQAPPEPAHVDELPDAERRLLVELGYLEDPGEAAAPPGDHPDDGETPE